jgi:beta-mannosidase
MLPTSASGDWEMLDVDAPWPQQDVHGPWKYGGPVSHYRMCNKSNSQLHSEFGCDGMGNISALRRFLSPKNLRVTSMHDNTVWRHHGEWWDTLDRDEQLFGPFAPDDLEVFIKCSQFIQAEGLRYWIEANRRRAFANCGSIIWQCNEPWPNVSCTNLIDFYGQPKLAYFYVKAAYGAVCPSLRYDRLVYAPNTLFNGGVYIANDLPDGCFVCTVLVRTGNTALYEHSGELYVESGSTGRFADFSLTVPAGVDGFTVLLTADCGALMQEKIEKQYQFFVAENGSHVNRRLAVEAYDRMMPQ